MDYQINYEKDCQYGLSNETDFYSKLKTKFGEDLVKKTRYCKHDFVSDKYIIELKTRRNEKTKYATTMIGLNKLQNIKDKKLILCFRFTDTDCYYEYNPEDNLEIGKGGRKDRGRFEYGDYCYIPVSLLTDF